MRPTFKALMDTPYEERLAAYRDPAWREKARADLEEAAMMKPRWDDMTIEEARGPGLVGRSIADVATERGLQPFEAMLDISLAEDLEPRFRSTLANDDQDTITELLQQDGVLMGLSDAGAHVSQLCDACLPTDLLGNWVRGREVLTLERAVHKLTGEPAGVYGFEGRGVLAVGNHADVVVFDPDTVAPGPVRRIRDFPADGERLVADQPSGMRHVLVNGTPIRVDGETAPEGVAAKPGTILRG
jgi:N-acyl-D-aspartate/D-glutamate deacylase